MSTWMQGQVEAQAEKCSLKVNIVRPKHCVMSKTALHVNVPDSQATNSSL